MRLISFSPIARNSPRISSFDAVSERSISIIGELKCSALNLKDALYVAEEPGSSLFHPTFVSE